jgi:hypothetical protein
VIGVELASTDGSAVRARLTAKTDDRLVASARLDLAGSAEIVSTAERIGAPP